MNAISEEWQRHIGPGPTMIDHPIRANSARKLKRLRKYARRCTTLSFWYVGVKPDVWPNSRNVIIHPHGECQVYNVQLEFNRNPAAKQAND